MSATSAEVRLGDVSRIISGFAFKSEGFNVEGRGMPLIRIRDVLRGSTNTFFEGPYDDNFLVRRCDILIGMDGEFNRERWRGDVALLNQRVCKIEGNAEYLDNNYLFHFLPAALKKIEDRTPFVTVKHLSAKDLWAISMILPPLDEQKRIAAILDKADQLRQKRRQTIALLDSLTQSIFLEMFGDPVSNPKGWAAMKIGDLEVDMTYGPRFYNEQYVDDGIRIVRITDLASTGELNYSAMPRLRVPDSELLAHQSRPGDILFARTGATVGKTALIRESDPVCIPGAYFIRMRFPSNVLPEFAWATIRYPTIQKIIFEGSRQSAQQNFSGPGLRRLPFILPPIDEQRRFAQSALRAQSVGSLPKAGVDKLESLFASLQHRAFSGQL